MALLGPLAAVATAACTRPPPSILVITLDTLRRDRVGSYGAAPSRTPRLDALAARGLVHEAAYTTMPTTGPAHLSLFTGLYPSEHGSLRNAAPLRPEFAARDAARRLRARGYATAAFVTSPLLQRSATGLRGFEVYDAPRGLLRSGEQAARAARWWLEAEERRPVFLWLHLYDAHAPYGNAEDKRRAGPVDPRRYGFVDVNHFESQAARREVIDRYDAGVSAADAALGHMLDAATAALGSELLVIVAADHGESLAEHLASRGYAFDHGEFLDAECVSIPLVLAGTGVTPGRSAPAVSIRDLYTTLLAAAGVADPEATRERRRDLRAPSHAQRVVAIERRRLSSAERLAIRGHRAAAANGRALLIVGSGDASAVGPAARTDASAGLVERALARARARADAAPAPDEELPTPLRRALQSLGYTEE